MAQALRKRFGRSKTSLEDQTDGAIVDARLRAIDADPSRLIPFDEFARQIGLDPKSLRRG